MKIFATTVSACALLCYLALMSIDPTWGLLHPRGGMAMLGLSLVIANAAIWVAGQPTRPAATRFQLAAAGWIWIFVQGGGLVYLYSQTSAP